MSRCAEHPIRPFTLTKPGSVLDSLLLYLRTQNRFDYDPPSRVTTFNLRRNEINPPPLSHEGNTPRWFYLDSSPSLLDYSHSTKASTSNSEEDHKDDDQGKSDLAHSNPFYPPPYPFFFSYALPMYNPMLDQYEIACSLALPQRGNILPRDIISNLVLSKNSFSPGAP